MKPYYEQDGVTLYCGDARDVVAAVEAECLITDPVWPNCAHIFPDIDAQELLASVLELARVQRIVIQIGCASDVRFLQAVPKRFKFFRTCWLEYACPSYRGRVLNTGDVAYVFGEPPAARSGAMVIPGRSIASRTTSDDWRAIAARKRFRRGKERTGPYAEEHPTPRRLEHVAWLVKWFGGASVIDPFAGSGTTLLAAKRQDIPAIGIEIEERYCRMAVSRLRQRRLPIGDAIVIESAGEKSPDAGMVPRQGDGHP